MQRTDKTDIIRVERQREFPLDTSLTIVLTTGISDISEERAHWFEENSPVINPEQTTKVEQRH